MMPCKTGNYPKSFYIVLPEPILLAYEELI